MVMSGYLFLEKHASSLCSCVTVKWVRCLLIRCFSSGSISAVFSLSISLSFWRSFSKNWITSILFVSFSISIIKIQGANTYFVNFCKKLRHGAEAALQRCSTGKVALKMSSKIHRRIPMQSKFIEIILQHGCSPVSLLRIFRTSFLRTPLEGCFWWCYNIMSKKSSYDQYQTFRCKSC